ncbi:hypothetical protein PYCCODRAFT_1467115 [Trametes coccinea BRFM310]|uniref:Fungal pheromone STE3G-protein-coupled receptor n=1 Tax=Trametes coccinea (strain BRFM310) TaxID=1353009 RepID=A0A1Y2IRK3_TRAC3|nr:hypothetical protein PYCCODRAFT_1467115 [Trametes coccinea BRFM310]
MQGAQLGYLTPTLWSSVAHGDTIAEPPPPDLEALTPVFLTIHLVGGHIGLPLLVATFLFSKTAKRHPAVINFCVTWILYSIVYCLLLYGGRDLQEHPPYELCLAQAAMNYAAPPMAVVAGLGVVLQIWTTFREPWKEERLANIPRWLQLLAIISPPYLVFIAFAFAGGYYGIKNPHWVTVKNGLYCGLMHGKFEMLAVPIFCGVFILCIIGVELATFVRWLKGRHFIKKVCPLVEPKKPSLSPWCRAALFLVYATLTLSACIMDLRQDMNTFAYMIQAALPLAAFLVFGLQKDVILVWVFWHRKARWMPDDQMFEVAAAPNRVVRTLSLMSGTTINSTTPIATHPSSSLAHADDSVV